MTPESSYLQHPLPSDQRYSVRKEFCGHPEARLVLRFCGEFLGSFTTYPEAVMRAAGHRASRQGAFVVGCIPAPHVTR